MASICWVVGRFLGMGILDIMVVRVQEASDALSFL